MTSAARDELILSLERTVKAVAFAKLGSLPHCVRLDDIISAGWVGAIAAVDRFDPTRGTPLAAFANLTIRGAIGDYLRSVDPITRDHRRVLKANPDEKEPRTFSITRIDDRRSFEIDDARSWAVFHRIEARLDVQKLVRRAGAKPRAISIITRHARGEKMKAIGRSLGVNESRVSQIRKATLIKLRAAA